nr:putative reverse transcriptase domain, aspartic peptidase domain protein [Tanacetum cinerariifolium]
MRKGENFVWNEERENSFEELKQRLVSAPVLTLPSGSGGFQIYSDASKKGMIAGIKVEEEIIRDLERLGIELYVSEQQGYWASLRIEPDLISRIKEAQKEDSEIWTIVENLNKQVELRLDDDNVL